ncbi:MAG: response regulator [Treponema sp.]|nr:response regulator [Treponema sp.]
MTNGLCLTVLIVDDSRYMRNIVRSYFSELNFACTYLESPDGKDALKQLLARHVDLVLLDWNMPKMTGIEFLKLVRGMEPYKDLPIVMVTSEGAKLNVVEAFKNGITDYVIKPIDGEIFKEKILEIFDPDEIYRNK